MNCLKFPTHGPLHDFATFPFHMNSTLLSCPRYLKKLIVFSVAAVVAAATSSQSFAQDVIYSPFSRNVEGNMPYTRSVSFNITAPDTLTGPVSGVGFNIVPTAIPFGTTAQAKSYVSISPSTLNFSGPGASQSITVTVTMPSLGIPPNTVLQFAYQIFTTNWGVTVSDAGMSLNAKVTAPPPQSNAPPIVAITTPINGAEFTYFANQLPTTIPMSFVADTVAPMSIISIDATLNGNALDLTPSGGGSVTGIGTLEAIGTAQMPIPAPGVYTIVVHGSNAIGVATATSTFTVIINGPPPTVVIDEPAPVFPLTVATYDHAYGAAPVNVPFRFTANAPTNTTIRSLEAKLYLNDGPVGTSVTFAQTGMFTTTAVGTANLDLITPGTHRLWVRTTNEYGEATTSKYFTINPLKAVITVTADSKSKVYGTNNPALTYTLSGFVNGETLATSGITGTPGLSTTATQFSPVLPVGGSYPIVPSLGTLASSNYQFVFVAGGLTVTKALLTVTASPAIKVYGAPLPLFGYTIAGFLGTDTAAVVSGVPSLNTTATPASVPGGYPIVPTLGSLSANNYGFAFVNGTLTVTKATLTFTALDASRPYGETNPPFSYIASGFVNGDTDATAYQGDPTLSTAAVATSSVAGSPYAISIGPDLDLISAKYNFAFVNANLTITRAPLTVTADNKSKVQGAANPTLTYTATGFVNGETIAVLTTPPALTTTATTSSPVGSYPITNTATLAAANYTITFVPGSLTVTAAPTALSISGTVFFDANVNGARNPDEPGLENITVKLYQGYTFAAQTTTSSTGAFSFNNVAPGTYYIDAIEPAGLTSSTANFVTVVVSTANVTNVDIGMALNFCAIRGMKANGFTIGYWKNNIDKAIAGKTGGTQVSAANIEKYTTTLGSLALSPYTAITKAQASAIMASTSSIPADLLSKQLVASEYNYASGGYIGGSKMLTLCFLTWGEYVLKNSASYSSTYIIFVQKWCDAYNNSHGGYIDGPSS